MNDGGYGKEGGELKNVNGVKGKTGQEKGKSNKKSVINVYIYKNGKQMYKLQTSPMPY